MKGVKVFTPYGYIKRRSHLVTDMIRSKSVSELLPLFSYPSVLIFVFGAEKNRLVEKVLFNTNNKCLDQQPGKLVINCILLSGNRFIILPHAQLSFWPKITTPP